MMSTSQKQSLFFFVLILVLVGAAYIVGIKQGAGVGGSGSESEKGINSDTSVSNVQERFASIFSLQEHDATRGSGDILLIEYSDYECPFCQRFHATAQSAVDDGLVTWVYRHLPLSIHQTADYGAVLAECVRTHKGPDAFWEYTDAIFETNDARSRILYNALAEEQGINKSAIEACSEAGSPERTRVANGLDDALFLGINGTPGGLIINTKNGEFRRLAGAIDYATLRKVIESIQ